MFTNARMSSGQVTKFGKKTNPYPLEKVRCQKCLEMGHWSYECKGKRKYLQRTSRTNQLKKAVDSTSLNEPEDQSANEETVRKKSKHKVSSSSSGSSSDSDSASASDSSTDSTSSSSDSSTSSDSESDSSDSSTSSSSSSTTNDNSKKSKSSTTKKKK